MVTLYERPNMGSTIHFINSSMTDTLRFATDYGLYSLQFFLGGNMGFKRAKLSDKDVDTALKLQERFPINIYSHMPYCYNLCGSIKSLAWTGDNEQDVKSRRMIDAMKGELATLAPFQNRYGNCGCVVHIGSANKSIKRNTAIETVSETINKINKEMKGDRAPLLLENCAGEGNKLGRDLEELRDIYELVSDKSNLGICIDTCHLFGAGTYDLGKKDHIDKMFKEFDSMIGLEKLKLVHFNDSKKEYKSRKDSHESIGSGFIWDLKDKKRSESLKHFIYSLEKFNIPSVLETWLTDYEIIQSI